MFLVVFILALFISASYQKQHPKIASSPSRPLIGRSGGDATFNWTFTLWPGRTWNESVVEVVFGIWKAPGYIMPKLIVISRQGQVLTRPHFEDKVSCKFDMSRLQVAFMLHNLSVLDEKQHALQVEFGLAHNPLTDVVALLLHDPPEIISLLKRNIHLKTGADLDLKCEAKGLPDPQVTWSRNGRLIMNNQTLVLRQVTNDDSGLYLCKANNVAGEDRIEVNLNVGDDEEMIQTTVSRGTTAKHVSARTSKAMLLVPILSAFLVLMVPQWSCMGFMDN